MPTESSPADSHRLVRLAEKMHDKEYRDGYVAAHNRQVLAKQMREFRGDKSQTDFAELLDKKQTVVSRLENPSYPGWTLSTLFEVASKLNVAVFVRFVDFPTFLKYSGKQEQSDLHPNVYDQIEVDDFAQAEAEYDASIRRILEKLKSPTETPTKEAARQEPKSEGPASSLLSKDRESAADYPSASDIQKTPTKLEPDDYFEPDYSAIQSRERGPLLSAGP
jgi:hypothetical protein